jgi:CRISPR-associated protein Csb1
VAAVVYGFEADHDLRSRCLLVPEHPPLLEMVGRDGGPPAGVSIDRDSASQLLSDASAQAARAGIGWMEDQVVLTPAPKLVELLRRSREVSASEPAGD